MTTCPTLGRRRTGLAIRLQDHPDDDDGWRELFTLMSFLVLGEARRYLPMIGSGGGIEDLKQAGNFGIVRAVERFDRRRGKAFATSAKWHVRQQVQMTASRMGSGMVPRVLRLVALRGPKAGKSGRSDRTIEAARECEARAVERIGFATPENESGLDVEDRRCSGLPDADDLATLDAAISALDDREADVIVRRFGLGDAQPETLMSVVASLGLSRDRVRQIERGALAKMREAAGA